MDRNPTCPFHEFFLHVINPFSLFEEKGGMFLFNPFEESYGLTRIRR
jgi:hypothetical protein